MGMIPKDKDGVFGFAIDWPVLEGAPADVHDKISGTVAGSGYEAVIAGRARSAPPLPFHCPAVCWLHHALPHAPLCPPVPSPPAGWVGKKVRELLGEEPSFVSFIMDQLKARTGAQVGRKLGLLWGKAVVLDAPFNLMHVGNPGSWVAGSWRYVAAGRCCLLLRISCSIPGSHETRLSLPLPLSAGNAAGAA